MDTTDRVLCQEGVRETGLSEWRRVDVANCASGHVGLSI
jgi:hypothetical protein